MASKARLTKSVTSIVEADGGGMAETAVRLQFWNIIGVEAFAARPEGAGNLLKQPFSANSAGRRPTHLSRRRCRFAIRSSVTAASAADLYRKNDKTVSMSASAANITAAYAICCGYWQISGFCVHMRKAQFGAAAWAIFAEALKDV